MDVLDRRSGRRHLSVAKGLGDAVDYRRVNQRFVPLDVDRSLDLRPLDHFRDAVGPAGVIGRGHFHPAKLDCQVTDALVVGGNDHFVEETRRLTALDHMLKERLARDQRGCVPRWYDANEFHDCLSIQSAAARMSSTTTARWAISGLPFSNFAP